jgi:hypothetical protein
VVKGTVRGREVEGRHAQSRGQPAHRRARGAIPLDRDEGSLDARAVLGAAREGLDRVERRDGRSTARNLVKDFTAPRSREVSDDETAAGDRRDLASDRVKGSIGHGDEQDIGFGRKAIEAVKGGDSAYPRRLARGSGSAGVKSSDAEG